MVSILSTAEGSALISALICSFHKFQYGKCRDSNSAPSILFCMANPEHLAKFHDSRQMSTGGRVPLESFFDNEIDLVLRELGEHWQ
jgi:hypothetical protein